MYVCVLGDKEACGDGKSSYFLSITLTFSLQLPLSASSPCHSPIIPFHLFTLFCLSPTQVVKYHGITVKRAPHVFTQHTHTHTLLLLAFTPGWEYFRTRCVREKLKMRQDSPLSSSLLLMSPCRCQALCYSTALLIGMIATLVLPPVRPARRREWNAPGAPMIQVDVSLELRRKALSL